MVSSRRSSQNQAKDPQGSAGQKITVVETRHVASLAYVDARTVDFVAEKLICRLL
jgi:hypothetical protein